MKILVVDQGMVLSAERAFYRALHQMKNTSVTLIAPALWREEFGTFRFEIEPGCMPVIASKTLFTGKSHRAVYLAMPKALKETDFDILFINAEPESYLAWQAVVARNKISPRTKIIFISWRNIDYQNGKFPYKLAWFNARAERTVLAHADHCIARNDSAREILLRRGFNNVTIIPPAVDTSVFKRSERSRREQLGLIKFTIGFVGRFIPLKGVDLLLRAAQKLDFEYQLLLVGDGPAKSEWLGLARQSHVDDHIVWKDPVLHSEVPLLLSAMDVLVLPSSTGSSWKEQFGRVLIEAMACEVPVIGSSSGEIPRVIGAAGLVFQEGNEDELCARLSEIKTNTERRLELIQRGLTRAREHFSVPVVAQEYEKLFRRLVQA